MSIRPLFCVKVKYQLGSELDDRCLPRSAHYLLSFQLLGVASLKKFNTETHVYRTKFVYVTIIYFDSFSYLVCSDDEFARWPVYSGERSRALGHEPSLWPLD